MAGIDFVKWSVIAVVVLFIVMQQPMRSASANEVTFETAHAALLRLIVNESGWESLPDADGIFQSVTRDAREQNGRINLSRMVMRIAAHSPRTFPAGSRFIDRADIIARLEKNGQSVRHRWTSSLRLDCSEPNDWPYDVPWSVYADKCKRTVVIIRSLLAGEIKTQCNDEPMTWGNDAYMIRPGGPIDLKWREVFCDSAACRGLEQAERIKLRECAANRFWNWKRIDGQ